MSERSSLWIRLGTVAVACGAIAADALNDVYYDGRVRWLSTETHRSVFGAASLAALAAACGAAALGSVVGPSRRAWQLLTAALATLLVLRVLEPPHVLIAAVPAAAVAVVLLYRPEGALRGIVREGCFLLAVSFALHLFGDVILDGGWPCEANGAVRHAAELSGWMLVAGGLAYRASIWAPRRWSS